MSGSEKSGSSWMSAVGRFFANQSTKSGNDSNAECKESTSLAERAAEAKRFIKDVSPANGTSQLSLGLTPQLSTPSGRGLRYLSPTLDNGSPLGVSISKPAEDIFAHDDTFTRKRHLRPLAVGIEQGSAKRFRGQSMLEEPIRVSVTDRLSTTGGMTAFDASPASSVRSLRSRVSETASTTSSGLSSKTRAILQQLERVRTPASDARKLPFMRGTGDTSEKWAPLQSSPSAPPLCRSMGAVPSRIQLLSSTLGSHQKKPYWRDVLRKPRREDRTSDVVSVDHVEKTSNIVDNVVHPLFDVTEKSPPKSVEPRRPQPAVKGSDGKRTNFFSAKDLQDDSSNTPLPNVAVPIPTTVVPTQGFLDDMMFSFAAPKAMEINHLSFAEPDLKSDEKVASSDSEESDLSDSDESDSGSGSDSVEEKEVNSRPPTSTDSETTATPASSKNTSPVNPSVEDSKKVESWDCPMCFVSNKSAECVACGHKKGASADDASSQKTLVSNLDSFAPKSSTGVSFGFGAASNPTPSVVKLPINGVGVQPSTSSSASATPAAPAITPATLPLMSSLATPASTSATATSAPAVSTSTSINSAKPDSEQRVDWSCPDCMVSNKATDDKCVCCGFVKYKGGATSESNVFGDRAFKPTVPSSTGFSFGTGQAKPLFGFGSSSTTDNAVAGSAGGIGQSSASSSSVGAAKPLEATPSPILFGGASKESTFGEKKLPEPSSSSLFGLTAQTLAPAPPLFGSTPAPEIVQIPEKKQELPASLPSLFPPVPAAKSTSSSFPPTADASKPTSSPFVLSGNPFGAPTSSATVPGSSATTTSSTGSLFSATAPDTKSLFSGASLFGKSSEPFGAAKEAPSGFGSIKTMPPSTEVAKPDAPSTAFMFGSTTNVSSGGSTSMFGSTSTPAFGATGMAPSFGSLGTPAAEPATLGNSSSTSSLFTATTEQKGGFNFGSSNPSTTAQPFQFGAVPSVNSNTPFMFNTTQAAPLPTATPFAFGASAPALPSVFSQGSTDSNSSAGGAFAFNASTSSTGRKIAPARRRLPNRR